ncbi:deoxyribonuclease-2-beta precursor [Alligator mississippiensis]|uniref:Deoxyribonuclease-2-alpha n=1 Tax=Alligator mississippiensis TaxID=8496 RepID=A0A151MMR0_ALLMI|nr:deoxyribonuclease-2-beta precursor [Alligator mississippiensis]
MCSLRGEVEVGVLRETGGAGASRIREIGLCPTPAMLPLLFMALSLTPAAGGGISCYDDNGQPVDWFVAYKLPHHSPGQGLRYHYLDARRGDWVSGRALINSSQGALGTTLRQLYQAATTQGDAMAYVLYNDQPPRANTSISTRFAASHGHTKGVVLLDGTQGLWLVHSAPHFPPPTATTFAWPPTASRFGQTFLCITFPYASFQDIGQQLLVNQPLVYDSSVGGAFAQDLPDLALAASMKPVKAPPWNRSVTLPSLGGAPFLSLAKHRRFHDDLYSGWLAAALGDTLLVESWRDGPGDLPSNCSGPGPQVLNVAHVAFPDMPAFATTQDHSKWAVADTAAWACVADTNRNRGEEQRGGGAVCLPHRPLWKAFRGLVQDYDPCP